MSIVNMPDRGRKYTIEEPPPPPANRRRASYWAGVIEEARTSEDWVRADRPLSKSTAQQMASDIRRAHVRSDKRIAGIEPGEVWDARWGPIGDNYYVWVLRVPDWWL